MTMEREAVSRRDPKEAIMDRRRVVIRSVPLVAAAVAALLASAGAQATSAGDNGLIVFEAGTENGTGTQLFTIKPDGSDIRQITQVQPSPMAKQPGASKPDWSPDGRTIVFNENTCQVALIDADGSNLREVPAEPAPVAGGVDLCETNPTFSADGRSLIYERFDLVTGSAETWIMSLDGSDKRLVTDACPNGGYPSPDGMRFACFGPAGELLVADMDGTDAGPILPGRGFGPRFDWAPDGRALMITTNQRPDEGANVATVAPDGSDLRFLTDYDPELGALAMSYSPDGTSVLFRLTQVDPDVEERLFLHALARAAADGSGVEQLTDFSVNLPGLDGVAFETGQYPQFDWGVAPTE